MIPLEEKLEECYAIEGTKKRDFKRKGKSVNHKNETRLLSPLTYFSGSKKKMKSLEPFGETSQHEKNPMEEPP